MDTNISTIGKSVRTAVIVALAVSVFTASTFTSALAEVKKVRLAEQFGLLYLSIMVVVDQKLIQKHAKEMGLGDIAVEQNKFSGGGAMFAALLSDQVDFISTGITPVIRLWAKTKGNVKAVMSIANTPMYLNTVDPKVRKLEDYLTAGSKIGLPAVKISPQAVSLQMMAAKMYGKENYKKFDAVTVSMKHPDAMASILGGNSEVKSHYATMPFLLQELQNPNVRTILKSYDVVGGEHVGAVMSGTRKWKEDNPKTYKAVVAAFEEAMDFINANPRKAAKIYIQQTRSKKLTVDALEKMISDPKLMRYTSTPTRSWPFIEFMTHVGNVKGNPKSWKDLFWENVHDKPGS